MMDEWYNDPDEYDYMVDRFAEPGSNSALHAASKEDPRDLPCPTCNWPNRLTRRDKIRGYQCDSCANAMERGTDIVYYEGENDGA